MRFLLTMFFIFPLTTHACLELKQDSIKVQWTGYKTAAKVGVSGIFTDVKHQGKTKAETIDDLINGASLAIKLSTPSSGDASRDSNLKNKFFKLIGNEANAKVTTISKGLARVDLKMGKKTVDVALVPDLKDDVLTLTGTLDMFDFAIDSAFASISKTCLALHEGKTWNDVALKITANVTPCKAQ